jgi:selenocysteine lyase/cysteine desulfurase
LAKRLQDALDPDRYECITREVERSPIITFVVPDRARVQDRLQAANVVVALSGNRMRVSPAVFNTEGDIDRLAEALA